MKPVLTTGDVAKRCHVSLPTVFRWIKNGHLSAYTLPNGHHRIAESEFKAFLARHDDFILLPYSGVWEEALGTPPPGGGEMLNLTPLKNGTDGFFGAVLQRAATTLDSSHCDP